MGDIDLTLTSGDGAARRLDISLVIASGMLIGKL
jgi:hypothetical protein